MCILLDLNVKYCYAITKSDSYQTSKKRTKVKKNTYSSNTIKNSMAFKKRLLLSCIHHFKSEVINNIDHMRISGTDPRVV